MTVNSNNAAINHCLSSVIAASDASLNFGHICVIDFVYTGKCLFLMWRSYLLGPCIVFSATQET